MTTTGRRLLVALAATALLGGATGGPAAAAPPAPPRTAGTVPAASPQVRLLARAEPSVLPPGGTTRVVTYVEESGQASAEPLVGATYRVARQGVVRVARDGTVHALRTGTATVEVRHRRARTTVTVEVRERALVSQDAGTSPSCGCSAGVLGGFGFTPGAEITFTTDGTPGVHVDARTTADADGAFHGQVDPWTGDGLSGVVWVVDHPTWDPANQCERGTPYTITATDAAGLVAEHHAVC